MPFSLNYSPNLCLLSYSTDQRDQPRSRMMFCPSKKKNITTIKSKKEKENNKNKKKKTIPHQKRGSIKKNMEK
ncbi:hypothetical protein JT163_00810, partial [Helicobacter pylori]|nr:hypothetical protein [Helicobacter pylori]